MPRELRALHQRHGLSCAGSSSHPAHTLSARVPAPAQTLASVATQGQCRGEEQQGVAVGVVVGKGCLKRLGAVAIGGGSGAAKKVSFASAPQVRVMSPPAMGRPRSRGALPGAEAAGEESRHPRHVQFGGDYSVLPSAAAPVIRSMRNATNLVVGVEQVTVAVCNSAKFEEQGDVGETVDRKQKRNTRENSEHMVVSAQISVSRRNTRSSGLLLEAPFMPPLVVEKKRARSKGLDVKEQTLEEQPAKVQDSGRTLNSEFVIFGDVSRMVAESKRNKRKVQEDEPVVHKSAIEETYGRITRSRSIAAAVMPPVAVENIRTRRIEGAHSDRELPEVLEVPVKDAPVLAGLRSRAVQGKNSVEEENHVVKKLENRRQHTKQGTRSNSYQELASSVEVECLEQVVAPLRRSSRNHSKAGGLLLNNNTSSESNNWTRAREEGNGVKIACLSTHNVTKDDIEEGMAKEEEHLELSLDGGAKDCDGMEEQIVQTVVRKGCLKHSGAVVSRGSSGIAKKVTFKLVERPATEVAGFRRRPRIVADGEGDTGEAGSIASLRWSSRNVVNFGAGDGVERMAAAVSRNISAKADEEDEDAGEAVDRKRKASESVEDIGYVWFLPDIATQFVAATRSVANKMATKVAANFGKKLSLYLVDHGANKVGQDPVVAMDQIDA
ncbi:unnamed protein product [Alopecurus aequalis]